MKSKLHKTKIHKYLLSVLLMLVLLSCALLGPEFLFSLQDRYQSHKTWQGTRNNLDITMLNASYRDRKERFTDFAKGLKEGKKYYVSSIDSALTADEQTSILDQLIEKDYLWLCFYMNILPESFYKQYYNGNISVSEWKKYIIFDNALDENNTSVAFMTWYLELSGPDNNSIKILVDTNDLTVYYIQGVNLTNSEPQKEKTDYVYVKSKEYLERQEEFVASMYYYWQRYFDPDIVNYNTEELLSELSFRAELYFDDKPLYWEFVYDDKAVYMGIEELGALIPEFSE